MNIDEMKDRIARAEEIQRYTENRCNALEAEIKTLGERCNQLLKDKGDLIDELTKKADTNHSLVEQMADLEKENRTISRKANEAIADKLIITAKYNEVLNSLNQENDKLQKENAELREELKAIDKAGEQVRQQINDAFRDKPSYAELEKENAGLKAQIKKIKKCANCNIWIRNDDIKYCKNCPNLEGVKILRH